MGYLTVSRTLRNAYLLNILALVGVGVVMVFSSSAIRVVPGADIDPSSGGRWCGDH